MTFYWYMALGTSALMLVNIRHRVRMLGSYRMLLELMGMERDMEGEDRFWKVRPDEQGAMLQALGVILISGLCWPYTLALLVKALRDQ